VAPAAAERAAGPGGRRGSPEHRRGPGPVADPRLDHPRGGRRRADPGGPGERQRHLRERPTRGAGGPRPGGRAALRRHGDAAHRGRARTPALALAAPRRGGRIAGHAPGPGAGGAGRAVGLQRPDHRRDRDRQGRGRPGDPHPERGHRTLPGRQLRHPAARAVRQRAVRPHQGGVLGCRPGSPGAVRGGQRRDPVPGRGGRAARRGPGPAAADPGERTHPAGGRDARAEGGRPGAGRQQPGDGTRHGGRDLPPRPVRPAGPVDGPHPPP